MKLSKLLRSSLFVFGTSKAYSAIDADGAVDEVFPPDAAAVFNVDKPGLVSSLADMVAASTSTPNLRSVDSVFVEEEDFPPPPRGSSEGKDPANQVDLNGSYDRIVCDSTTWRNNKYSYDCCSSSNKCGIGEGDCDWEHGDVGCKDGLKCGSDNCLSDFGWGPSVFDCCFDPNACDATNNSDNKAYATANCCTSSNKCNVGQGDCDWEHGDVGCKSGLKCGKDNCLSDFGWGPAGHDCCYNPNECDVTNSDNTNSCCTLYNKCDVGQGDCDSEDGDVGCKDGLKCGTNNCLPDFGWGPAAHDCCYDPDPAVNCINGYTSSGKTCEEECDNGKECCGPPGANACRDFTGKVARDKSCMGTEACAKAGQRGTVGRISGASCVGNFACWATGREYGHVGDISGASCIGASACYGTGAYRGTVGDISASSCNVRRACIYLGDEYTDDLGDLSGCCTTDDPCPRVKSRATLSTTCTSGKATTSKDAHVVSLPSVNNMM